MKIVTLLLFFIFGMAISLTLRIWQVKKLPTNNFVAQISSFSFQVPEKAVSGQLVNLKDTVRKLPREGKEFVSIKENEKILVGEKLVTSKNSQVQVLFSDLATISLGSNSEIAFVSLIPESFLINQLTGRVTYEAKDDQHPISVRSLNLLLMLEKGNVLVITDAAKGETNIFSSTGQGKIAVVDLDNNTNIWQIKEGVNMIVDNNERTVKIVDR